MWNLSQELGNYLILSPNPEERGVLWTVIQILGKNHCSWKNVLISWKYHDSGKSSWFFKIQILEKKNQDSWKILPPEHPFSKKFGFHGICRVSWKSGNPDGHPVSLLVQATTVIYLIDITFCITRPGGVTLTGTNRWRFLLHRISIIGSRVIDSSTAMLNPTVVA